MSFPMKMFAIDAAPGLIKREVAQAALTATGYVGTQWDQGEAAATDFICVINVESCKISAGDEKYTLRIAGSNVADRSDAQVLDTIELGHNSQIFVETVDTAAGDQRIMRCRSDVMGTEFRYIDLHLAVNGTSPSIGFAAHISKEF